MTQDTPIRVISTRVRQVIHLTWVQDKHLPQRDALRASNVLGTNLRTLQSINQSIMQTKENPEHEISNVICVGYYIIVLVRCTYIFIVPILIRFIVIPSIMVILILHTPLVSLLTYSVSDGSIS